MNRATFYFHACFALSQFTHFLSSFALNLECYLKLFSLLKNYSVTAFCKQIRSIISALFAFQIYYNCAGKKRLQGMG